MFYECTTHGRLEHEGCRVIRKGIVKEVRCNDCHEIAEQKFIIVCKYHGELTTDLIKPTKKGHGTCRICFRQTANAKRNGNREEFNAKQSLDRKINPEKWDKIYKRAYQNKREIDGDLYSLKKVCNARGITLEDYNNLFKFQEGKCAICLQEETCKDPKHDRIRRLSIDHCHTSGKARGLLCQGCNVAIGRFKDDINLMERAIEYVKHHYHRD